MDRETESFVLGSDDTLPPRRKKLLGLRSAIGGVYYGTAAYGYPLGAITGVQGPSGPPVSPDQFSGSTPDAGAGQDSGDAGSAGADSGGAV